MKRLLTAFLLALSLTAFAGSALIPDMKFRRLDTRDGLSNAQVQYMFQDSKGFVWIGTSYGLNRYDGYRFRTYYSDPNDTTTLRSDYVDMMWEDINGKFWLKQGMNYSYFDPVTENVVRNPSAMLAKLGITGGIDRIYVDSKKNLWVKTYTNGLYCYNPKTKKITLTKYGYGPDEFPNEFWFADFAEDEGLLIVTSSDGEMMAIDGDRGKVVWKDSYMRQHGGQEKSSYDIVIDNFGNYWILTSSSIFIKGKKENKWFHSINDFLASKGITEGIPENIMAWDILMDHRNWLWIATDHEGLLVVNLEGKEVKQFKNNKFDDTTLSENTVKHLLLDKAGNMWIAAYRNGLNQYIESTVGIKTLELGDVNTTVSDKKGNYWLGTDNRGIIKYNPITEDTVFYNKATSGIASDAIVASYCSRDGSLWFGTYNGGLIHITPDGKISNLLATGEADGLLNNNVWSVTEDKWGDIWIGTLGNGVQRMNRRTGKFKTWSTYNTKIRENFINSINWIKKGWLLVAHSTYYSLINPVSGQVMNFEIRSVPGQATAAPSTVMAVEDSRGLIWHGSMSGCCIIDHKTGFQAMLNMNNGLYGSSVVGIVEDLRHSMWVVTEHGISNVTPKKEEDGSWSFLIRNFSTKDGLQIGPYNQRSVSLTRDGKVLVGGLNGLDIIDPSKLSNSDNSERPIFSGLKLFGQQVAVGKEYEGRVILEESLDDCRQLVLRHDENQFTIQLATDKGQIHNPSRFIYQLEGFSDKWIKTEEVDPNITYMSLKHGHYTLHVRMLNDDGSMGEQEATLDITITPPLWRTRWMMLLYILGVLVVAWLWRKHFLKKQAERMQLEQFRRETEKKHWMSEMLKKTKEAEVANGTAKAEPEPEPESTGQLRKEHFDMVPMIRQECEQFVAPDDKIVKVLFFPFADTLEVNADRVKISRMLKILLDNSACFSPVNSKIKVYAEQQGQKAIIRVADNGIGIPSEVMPHLFEAIVGDEDQTKLHDVLDIVTAHGGTVNASENKGGGTVFTIELPLGEEVIEEAVIMDDNE